jgi:hypothetical protein
MEARVKQEPGVPHLETLHEFEGIIDAAIWQKLLSVMLEYSFTLGGAAGRSVGGVAASCWKTRNFISRRI